MIIRSGLGVCGPREDALLLAEAAHRGTPGRALDLGTGSGYVAIYLALRGWQVDAVDVCPRALAQARENAASNGVAPRVFRSDLYGAVDGSYDVIACNPPLLGASGKYARLLTATVRRVEPLANLLVRLVRPITLLQRLRFIERIAEGARSHLSPGGRLILVIGKEEEARLPSRVEGLTLESSAPVPSIPGLNIVTFTMAPEGARNRSRTRSRRGPAPRGSTRELSRWRLLGLRLGFPRGAGT